MLVMGGVETDGNPETTLDDEGERDVDGNPEMMGEEASSLELGSDGSVSSTTLRVVLLALGVTCPVHRLGDLGVVAPPESSKYLTRMTLL